MNTARTDLLDLLIKEASKLTADVLELTLVHPDGEELPAWTPGAHVDVLLPSGKVRTYSLCGDPADRSCYRIAVLRVADGRGGSRELHDLACSGSTAAAERRLPVRTPRNDFELVDAPSYLFLAGGIGITPILPMVRAASMAGRSWRLVYGGRTADSMAFLPELRACSGGVLDVRPQDRDGLLPVSALLADVGAETEIYACGPGGMLDACRDIAAERGLSSRLHMERFTASRDASADPAGRPIEVVLQRSGITLNVGADQSILDKVLEHNPGHPWSCREGTCGSCETTVLEGEVDHRDEILTEEEREANDTMFICVSRSHGDRLVLDL